MYKTWMESTYDKQTKKKKIHISLWLLNQIEWGFRWNTDNYSWTSVSGYLHYPAMILQYIVYCQLQSCSRQKQSS